MMNNSPQVVVIDDELQHLKALADVLESNHVPCLRVHHEAEQSQFPNCADVRLIIADLHLGNGTLGADTTTDYSVLGALLENDIKPSGAYSMLLWTRYPEHTSELENFLGRLQGVTKPFALKPLPKADFLDNQGCVIDKKKLNRQIAKLAGGWIQPKGALALVGAWSDFADEEIDSMVEDIYANRDGSED